MDVLIDKYTNKVAGLNQPATPLHVLIKLSTDLVLTKTIEYVRGEKKKLSKDGIPLYKTNIRTDEKGQEIYDETTESKLAVEFQTGIPVVWKELTPVMVPNLVSRLVTLESNAEAFTLDDIVIAKYRSILERSTCDYIIAQEFIEQNINVLDKDHAANTGVGFIQLLAKGQAKTNEIKLDATASSFNILSYEGDAVDIYINDVKVLNNIVILPSKTDKIIVTFKNTKDKPALINAYSIGY